MIPGLSSSLETKKSGDYGLGKEEDRGALGSSQETTSRGNQRKGWMVVERVKLKVNVSSGEIPVLVLCPHQPLGVLLAHGYIYTQVFVTRA